MSETNFDLVVIGSGPGGYVGAIRAAQLGLKTAVIEKDKVLGGTCTNVGCIPSKVLLESSEHYTSALHHLGDHGIKVQKVDLDLPTMMGRKNKVVKSSNDGVAFLFKKNKISTFFGYGKILKAGVVEVKGNDGNTITLNAKNIMIATGSVPTELPFLKFDEKKIVSSTGALALAEVPKELLVVGGGVIGLELGSVYARLGSKVTVVEYGDSIISTMDKTLSKELQKSLTKLGMEFLLNHQVTGAEAKGKKAIVSVQNSKGEKLSLEGDYCLVATGRIAYTTGLGLENIGIQVEERGKKITVSDTLETTAKGVYAIGDVVRGAMLAHKAEDEGIFVAEVIAGQKPHINYNLIPGVVYTWPEVASVGYTEEALKEKGTKYKSGLFPFKASGRAKASMDTDGLIKVLADADTDEILGVHMIGPRAADMIAEAVVAMEFRASAEDIARICHAHPTYTEAFKEASLAATANRAIHI